MKAPAICASTLLAVFALLTTLTARADDYDDTIAIFKKAGQSGAFKMLRGMFTLHIPLGTHRMR